jgi:hypothetical protein
MRIRLVGALAAVALLAIPSVSATGRVVGFPPAAVLVDVPIARTQAAPQRHSTAAHMVASVPAPALRTLPAPAVRALPEARPQDLVRVVIPLKAGDAPSMNEAQGDCPTAATCDIFGIADFRWKTDANGTAVIPFKYNDNNRRDLRSPDAPAVRAALVAAMTSWHHWDSNLVFRDDGETTAAFTASGPDGGCADGTNVVTWGRFDSPDTVGEAAMCLDRAQHLIRDADLALNVGYWWANGTDARRQVYDVQSIFTHELGHWLSLLDMYSPTASRQTMFGSAEPNETRKRTPALGDITGVQSAYPCGRGDSCPHAGIVND